MPKIDLHTHSQTSPDGSISVQGYKNAIESGKLDVIAITDHNKIDFAVMLQKAIGQDKIIVGEEITTKQGDIIGLYLTKAVPGGQEAGEVVKQIKDQGGIIYIPHPFETVRNGISMHTLNMIKDFVDIIEAPNGRSLQSNDKEATEWAAKNNVAVAASSDAHRQKALGKTYTIMKKTPTINNLKEELHRATYQYKRPSLADLLAPKYNRIMKRVRKTT